MTEQIRPEGSTLERTPGRTVKHGTAAPVTLRCPFHRVVSRPLRRSNFPASCDYTRTEISIPWLGDCNRRSSEVEVSHRRL